MKNILKKIFISVGISIPFIGLAVFVWWMQFGSPLAHGLKEMGL